MRIRNYVFKNISHQKNIYQHYEILIGMIFKTKTCYKTDFASLYIVLCMMYGNFISKSTIIANSSERRKTI